MAVDDDIQAPPLGLRSRMVRGPVAGLAWLVHRRITGPRIWLEVQVGPQGPMATARQLAALRRAADDPLVAGVLLDVKAPPGGWATVWDWRETIHHLRRARRWVEAWVEQPGEATLAIAAAADRITVPEGTTVSVPGVGTMATHQQAAMARLVSTRMAVIAAGLAAGSGAVVPASRGEYITGLCDSALTVMEAREDEMDLAEAASIAVTAIDTITALRAQVRAGTTSGQWEHVAPGTSKQLGEVVGMCSMLSAQATHTVVTGGGLGRRRPPRELDASPYRAIAHEGPSADESKGVGR